MYEKVSKSSRRFGVLARFKPFLSSHKYTDIGSFVNLYNTGEDEVREHIPTPTDTYFQSIFKFRPVRGDHF